MNRPVPGGCPSDPVLLLRLLGIVEEDEAARLDEHLRSCPRCEARLAALRLEEQPPEFPLPPGHVPPGLLSRWPGVRSSLPEPAALAVERHLARCAECAGDLARLERIREAPLEDESEFAVAGMLTAHLRREESAHRVLMRGPVESFGSTEAASGERAATPAPRPPRGTLLLGGYAALATAAAIAFAIRGPLAERPQAPGQTGAPSSDVVVQPGVPGSTDTPSPEGTGDSPPATTTSPPLVDPAPPAVVSPSWQVRLLPREPRQLSSVMRSEATATTLIERGNDPGALVVRIDPPLSITDDTAITLELRGSGGGTLARTRARGADFHGGGTVLLMMGGVDLPAGSYLLRLRTSGDGEAEVVDYPFVLAPRP